MKPRRTITGKIAGTMTAALLAVALAGSAVVPAGCASPPRARPAAAQRPSPAGPIATIVTTVPVADRAVSMAFDGRYLWVGSTSGGVTQVDTTINQPIRT